MTAYLGFGSNLGDRAANIREALRLLDETDGIRVAAVAPVIETEPLGPPQPQYLNTVAAVETVLDAETLFDCCQVVEKELGRDRTAEVRWGPRPIDVDILLFGKECLDTPRLTVPHLEMHTRRFVLAPLCVIAPDAWHARLRKTVRVLLDELP